MEFLKAFLIVIEVLCSLLLIGIILLQRSKSEGLGMAFGAGAGEALFGARAGNVLSKVTVFLGVVFIANTLVIGILVSKKEKDPMEELNKKRAQAPAAVQTQPGDTSDLISPIKMEFSPETAVDLSDSEPTE